MKQWLRQVQCSVFSLFATGSSDTFSHDLHLSFLPRVFPDWIDTERWILRLLSLYPKTFSYLYCHISFQVFFWHPKYSSRASWQNLSVKANSIPSFKRNLVASITEKVVIWNPSWVCQERNILFREFWVNSLGQFFLPNLLLRYPRKVVCIQWNLSPSAAV